ncbi:hypothetical protein [Paenarthrobacter sp. AB444]|uniref:hypothetical protein n=1 Tax=Paenarthrobacter sp. AB444 TaxID=3025681 RepID=UPI002365ED84|nr:hypothetical protein [Paenarthrobacter sp. AB444]MDD7833939.1 hypothetical protein [Paenarthrobacter sp. AB444]
MSRQDIAVKSMLILSEGFVVKGHGCINPAHFRMWQNNYHSRNLRGTDAPRIRDLRWAPTLTYGGLCKFGQAEPIPSGHM